MNQLKVSTILSNSVNFCQHQKPSRFFPCTRPRRIVLTIGRPHQCVIHVNWPAKWIVIVCAPFGEWPSSSSSQREFEALSRCELLKSETFSEGLCNEARTGRESEEKKKNCAGYSRTVAADWLDWNWTLRDMGIGVTARKEMGPALMEIFGYDFVVKANYLKNSWTFSMLRVENVAHFRWRHSFVAFVLKLFCFCSTTVTWWII